MEASSLSPSVLAWLRCFDAAARCGSFTRAAQVLHVSQGAVSQQVKKLEDWAGHALLLRTPAGLVPTPAGVRLLPATQQAFCALDAAVRRLRTAAAAEEAGESGESGHAAPAPPPTRLCLTLRLADGHPGPQDVALRFIGELSGLEPARLALANASPAGRARPTPWRRRTAGTSARRR